MPSKQASHIDPSEIDAIVGGNHGDPFAVLGMHGGDGAPLSVRTFAPQAAEVGVLDAKTGRRLADLERIHPDGFFAGTVPRRRKRFAYRFEMKAGDAVWQQDDAYRFPRVLGDLDMHLIGEGRHRRLYDHMGAHPMTMEGVGGVAFAVWAPNARRVSVVGDFNGWDGRRHPMRCLHGIGIWELFVPGLAAGTIYKFEVIGAHGERLPLKADPFAFAAEQPPKTGSLVHGALDHEWRDADWMFARADAQALSAPVSIYEVHLGSWRRGDGNRTLGYDDMADQLVGYAKDMGFTHIELLPVSEHPFSGSWGYQPIGLFAPTSRFGPPEAFARFVDACHRAGLGLIVDWVPAHFPSDEHGLAHFDGTALYEHADPREGFHKDWNTLIYNFGRTEVANFLVTNALFWLDRYHIDGLRVDAVASMLYRDYSRQAGEWLPNVHGGRENLEAIAFLREMNTRLYGDYPGATSIAEESTAFPQVSRPVDGGGLGFGYKWNMGWMHDTLEYMKLDPVHRSHHQHQLSFGIDYAFSENFVLPLSHDEVVHGKGSLLSRMPGDRWQKFANLRAYFGFMWTHPGKKLLFMGGEFGQEREWNHDHSLDWHLTGDPMHRGVQALVRDLNALYRATPSLHQLDCDGAGFEWIDASDTANSIIVFLRKGRDGTPPALVICNFTPVVREAYKVGVPIGGAWTEVMNTDASTYGGSNVGNGGNVDASSDGWHGRPASLTLTLPPLATLVLQPAG